MENGYLPALSIVTGLVEVGFAAWLLRGPGRRDILNPLIALLVVLAGYQFLEVFACADPENTLIARIAFADVVWLPPLGLWLLFRCAAPDHVGLRRLGLGLFAFGGALALWVLLWTDFVVGTVCSTVIATYRHGSAFHHIYGASYELQLAGMVFGASVALSRLDDRQARAHIADLQMGVLGFMVPAFITQIAWRGLDPSLPSIMCHYAIVLAAFLLRIGLRERRAATTSA